MNNQKQLTPGQQALATVRQVCDLSIQGGVIKSMNDAAIVQNALILIEQQLQKAEEFDKLQAAKSADFRVASPAAEAQPAGGVPAEQN